MTGDESEAAREDLWLTYQNYDPAVKQAVRRLGALPGNNVEEFRNLLLASRERKRAKEFEADVVRRLQGEAFVDDEVLQQTLIVLHAENPQLAEQFKTFVAANGRPDDIDLTVARLRSGTDNPVMPERMPRKPRETPIMAQLITPELTQEPVPETPPPRAPVERPRPPLEVKPSRPAPMPVFANDPGEREITRDPQERASWPKYAAAAAIVLLIGGAGFFVLAPKSTDKDFAATSVPLRQAAAEDKQPVAAEPSPAAEPAKPNPPVQKPAEMKPAEMEARSEVASPPPASAAPSVRESAPDASPANAPVPGSRYRLVKGDMLSAIALQAYGDASMFRLIQRANPELRNADRIYYDQMITLPPRP